MAQNENTGARRSEGMGWSFAAALGLVAAAFFFDRIAAPDHAAQTGRKLLPVASDVHLRLGTTLGAREKNADRAQSAIP